MSKNDQNNQLSQISQAKRNHARSTSNSNKRFLQTKKSVNGNTTGFQANQKKVNNKRTQSTSMKRQIKKTSN